jgi:hypothetical protein
VLDAWQLLDAAQNAASTGVIANALECSKDTLKQAATQFARSLSGVAAVPEKALRHPFYCSVRNPVFLSAASQLLPEDLHTRMYYTNLAPSTTKAFAAARLLALFGSDKAGTDGFDDLAFFLAQALQQRCALHSFGWLLSLNDSKFGERFFRRLPGSVSVAHLGQYYFALRLLELPGVGGASLRGALADKGPTLYQRTIGDVIKQMDVVESTACMSEEFPYLCAQFKQSALLVSLLSCISDLKTAGLDASVFEDRTHSQQQQQAVVLSLSAGPEAHLVFALRLCEHVGLAVSDVYFVSCHVVVVK